MDNVGVVPARGQIDEIERAAGQRANANKQAVDRVVDHEVVVDVGTDAAIIERDLRMQAVVVERIRITGNARVRAFLDVVERDRRARGDEVYRVVRVLDGIDGYFAAAIAQLGVV